MAIEVFNRYEHKYILDNAAYAHILSVLDAHMELDAYNIAHKPYTIANLYYDTPRRPSHPHVACQAEL